MVENVFHAEQLKDQGHQEDIVRRIAGLNDMEAVPQENPPGINKLPTEGPSVLPQISHRSVAFWGHWVAVDSNAAEHLVAAFRFTPRTQDCDFVSVGMERHGFFVNAGIGGNRLILDDDENFSFGFRAGHWSGASGGVKAGTSGRVQQMLS